MLKARLAQDMLRTHAIFWSFFAFRGVSKAVNAVLLRFMGGFLAQRNFPPPRPGSRKLTKQVRKQQRRHPKKALKQTPKQKPQTKQTKHLLQNKQNKTPKQSLAKVESRAPKTIQKPCFYLKNRFFGGENLCFGCSWYQPSACSTGSSRWDVTGLYEANEFERLVGLRSQEGPRGSGGGSFWRVFFVFVIFGGFFFFFLLVWWVSC